MAFFTDDEVRNSKVRAAFDGPGIALSTKAEIALELYRACQALGARSDLLSIVGSYGDTLTDREVLDRLKRWNAANAQNTKPDH